MMAKKKIKPQTALSGTQTPTIIARGSRTSHVRLSQTRSCQHASAEVIHSGIASVPDVD